MPNSKLLSEEVLGEIFKRMQGYDLYSNHIDKSASKLAETIVTSVSSEDYNGKGQIFAYHPLNDDGKRGHNILYDSLIRDTYLRNPERVNVLLAFMDGVDPQVQKKIFLNTGVKGESVFDIAAKDSPSAILPLVIHFVRLRIPRQEIYDILLNLPQEFYKDTINELYERKYVDDAFWQKDIEQLLEELKIAIGQEHETYHTLNASYELFKNSPKLKEDLKTFHQTWNTAIHHFREQEKDASSSVKDKFMLALLIVSVIGLFYLGYKALQREDNRSIYLEGKNEKIVNKLQDKAKTAVSDFPYYISSKVEVVPVQEELNNPPPSFDAATESPLSPPPYEFAPPYDESLQANSSTASTDFKDEIKKLRDDPPDFSTENKP